MTTRTTVRTYVRRMSRLLEGTTRAEIRAARNWYTEANAHAYDISKRAKVTMPEAAGIIAAFSPRTPWKRNLKLAHAYAAGKPTPTLAANRAAADRIRAHGLESLTGPKVAPFARAIAGDPDAVVIDIWMMRAAGVHDRAAPSPVQLRRISEAVRTLARRHRMHPRDMQALLWIRARGSAD